MSQIGLDWYKREPIAYLKDVQGLTSKEHAVYSVILELLYIHGGTIRNDPKWISGWISDIGAASARNILASLDANPQITLTITKDEISQKRAKNEVKTKRKQRENAQETGRKGGKKSAELRAAPKENNNLDQPDPSNAFQPEKRREEKIRDKREDKSSLVVSGETPIDESTLAVSLYNDTAKSVGWPVVQKMTKPRRSALKQRLKECGGIDGWRSALNRAANSPHLTGHNDRGWTASFDFLLRQGSFTKLMEGNYDNRNSKARQSTGRMATESFVDENAEASRIAIARRQGGAKA